MQKFKVKRTDTNYTVSPNSYEFIKIYNRIFPLIIETEYVDLTNLLQDYISLCTDLATSHQKVDKIVRVSTAHLEERKSKVDETLRQVLELLNHNASEIDYNYLANLALEGANLSNKISTINRQEEKSTYFNESANANDLRRLIASAIAEIKSTMSKIQSLDNNNQKRIDNLEIREDHLALIDALYITPQEKAVLKKLLISYFKLRVASFRIIESTAANFVLAYHNNRLSTDLPPENLNEYNLATIFLTNISLIDTTSFSFNSQNCQILEIESLILEIIASYLTNKEVNQEQLNIVRDYLAKNPINHSISESFQYLLTELKRVGVLDNITR